MSFRMTLSDLEWVNKYLIQASRGLSATAELLVLLNLADGSLLQLGRGGREARFAVVDTACCHGCC